MNKVYIFAKVASEPPYIDVNTTCHTPPLDEPTCQGDGWHLLNTESDLLTFSDQGLTGTLLKVNRKIAVLYTFG